MSALPEEKIEKAIFPAGFYHTKAKAIRKASKELVERFGSRVPDTIEELLTLPGVGRKTANLVVTLAHNKAGICVDTHVHRITNRWGYVKTKTPHETEQALRAKLPKKHWIAINTILVMHGQNICKPVSPVLQPLPRLEILRPHRRDQKPIMDKRKAGQIARLFFLHWSLVTRPLFFTLSLSQPLGAGAGAGAGAAGAAAAGTCMPRAVITSTAFPFTSFALAIASARLPPEKAAFASSHILAAAS